VTIDGIEITVMYNNSTETWSISGDHFWFTGTNLNILYGMFCNWKRLTNENNN